MRFEVMKDREELGFVGSLMEMPLLKGVSRSVLEQLLGRKRLIFGKYAEGDSVLAQGDRMECITFLLNGSVKLRSVEGDGSIVIGQTIDAPAVIGPEFLFGLSTCQPYDVAAASQCGVLQLPKGEYCELLTADRVFMFNYLNMVCSMAQRPRLMLKGCAPSAAATRLMLWVQSFVQPGAKDISVRSSDGETGLHTLLGISQPTWRGLMERLVAEDVIASATPIEVVFKGGKTARRGVRQYTR